MSLTESTLRHNLSNNNTLGGTASDESLSFKVVKLFLYAVIFLISIVGNTLVVIVIVKRRRMRTVINYFIFNLAVADLAMTCICIPFDIPVQENGYRWPYGPVMCRVLYPLQTMCMFASIFTLTAVSLNRFWAIVYPLKTQMTKTHAKLVIGVIWFVSGVVSTPYVAVLYVNVEGMYCDEAWPAMEYRKAYTLSLFACQYLVPLVIILISYIRITIELRKCIVSKQGVNSNSVLNRAQQEDARKVVRMLVVVTLLFAVCVLPNNVMWLWLDFGTGGDWPHFNKTVAVTNIILFANSASNPVAYTICHERFREEFKLYITCNPKIFQNIQSTISRTAFYLTSIKENSSSDRGAATKSMLENIVIDSRETVL